jgi:TRAP-type C4-dicarboxylate transport system substrate-binding protein
MTSDRIFGRRVALGAALGMAVPAATVSGKGARAAGTHWDCYIYNAVATVAAAQGMSTIIDTVANATGGALNITLHLGGSLPINTTTITQAVSDGVVQMADDGYFLGNVPIAGVLRLPLLIRSQDDYDTAAAIMTPYIDKAFARKGVTVLGSYVYPPQVFFSRRPMVSLADVKGQKIRVSSPEQGEFIRQFGGIPVTLGAPDVPAALDRGVVDGALSATSGGGLTWRDLLKSSYRFDVNYFNSLIIVNADAMAALPAEQQAILRKAVTDELPSISRNMARQESEGTQQMANGGLIVTASRPQDVAEAADRFAPYWAQWAKAKGPEAAEALAKVRAALGR